MSEQLGRPQGKLRERSINRDISRKIRSPAMRVVKEGTKGGRYGAVSVRRCVGDCRISVFHGPGRCYRPEASSVNRSPRREQSQLQRLIHTSFNGITMFASRQRGSCRPRRKWASHALTSRTISAGAQAVNQRSARQNFPLNSRKALTTQIFRWLWSSISGLREQRSIGRAHAWLTV